MNNPEELNWIFTTDWLSVIKSLIILICLLVLIYALYLGVEKVFNKFGISTKRQREHDKNVEHISNNHNSIQQLKKTTENTTKTLNEIIPVINTISNNIDQINNKVDALGDNVGDLNTKVVSMEEKQEEEEKRNIQSKKAQHKDRLYQAYRYYKNRAKASGKKEWNAVEKDGFNSLVKAYEMYDGNSKVHEEVIPYMEGFIVVETNDDDIN